MKFGKWISTKDLYIVTLKELVSKELDLRTCKTNYIMLKTPKYTICKKKQNNYYDIFTNIKYLSIYITEQGSFGVSNIMPLTFEKKFVTLTDLSNKLKEIKEQEDISNNKNIPKTKKIIPFSKKY